MGEKDSKPRQIWQVLRNETRCQIPEPLAGWILSLLGPLLIWIRALADVYGCRLLCSLVLVQAILKGFVAGGGLSGMVGAPVDFLLRERQIEASSLQVYSAAVAIPWSIKPLMGLLSDVFPIAGYHRLPYMVFGALGGCASCLAIGMWSGMNLSLLLSCLFLIFYQVSLSDLMSEAVYSRKIQENPAHGPDLVSFVWGGIGVGKLFAVGVVGFVIEHLKPHRAYLIALPFAGLTLLVPMANLFEERPGPAKHFDRDAWNKDRPLFVVALILGFGSLALSLMSILGFDLTTKVAAAAVLACVVLVIFSLVLTPVIAKVNAFFFIQSLCAVSTHGASFFFFTDNPKQYPEGPNLSIVFYTTILGLVSTLFSLVGMFVYNRFMRHWRYPRILLVSNLLSTAVNLLSCIVYLRWNRLCGISDSFFILASSSVQVAIMELAWMPGVLINSQLCPRGREATMFALLAGCHNLGANLASYFGALLLWGLGVEPKGKDGEQDQFNNLWLAALISSVGPCLPLILLRVMIPNVTQTDAIDGIGDATSGSMWRRIMGQTEDSSQDQEMKGAVLGKSTDEICPLQDAAFVAGDDYELS